MDPDRDGQLSLFTWSICRKMTAETWVRVGQRSLEFTKTQCHFITTVMAEYLDDFHSLDVATAATNHLLHDFCGKFSLSMDLCFWLNKADFTPTMTTVCPDPFCYIVMFTISTWVLKKKELLLHVTLMLGGAPMDCVVVAAAISRLLAIKNYYWTNSKTFGQYEFYKRIPNI